jgi:hypothetical protein
MTDHDLKSYARIVCEIKQLEDLYKEEGRRICDPKGPNLTGIHGSSDGGNEALHRALDSRSAIVNHISELAERRDNEYLRLSRIFDSLDSKGAQEVFKCLYIRGMTISESARHLHYCRRVIYYYRNIILETADAVI